MTDESTESIIKRFRKQGKDDAAAEAKECASSLAKDVWESISSFANTEGGTIILGVSEANGFAPVEKFQIDRVIDQLLSGMGDGGSEPKLTNPPRYQVARQELDGHPILRIDIKELDRSAKPCFITAKGVQNGSFKRIDDKDIPLTPNEIFSLQTANSMQDSDRSPVPDARVEDLDSAILVQAFAKAQQVTPRALKGANDDEEKLRRLNFVNVDGRVTKAGLLTAGLFPQQFFTKLHVDVAVHAGYEKASDQGTRFIDRTICEGTVGEMIESAVSAVAKNLKRTSTIEGVGRVDELEIPVVVLREAIANALIHRDYDSRFDGEAVSVDVFDDRVEITNPGGLWGKSRNDMLDGRSCCRNPTLMRLMSIVPLPSGAGSPAEGNGTGMLLIVRECAEKGLERPVFHPALDHFKTILFRPAEPKQEKAPRSRVSEGELVVASLLERYGELSTRQLAQLSHLSVNQVRSRLNKLIDQGLAEPTAASTSRNRKYRRTAK